MTPTPEPDRPLGRVRRQTRSRLGSRLAVGVTAIAFLAAALAASIPVVAALAAAVAFAAFVGAASSIAV